MASIPEVPMPERPRGTPQEQINMLYRYAWQLAETLNNILNIMQKERETNDPPVS